MNTICRTLVIGTAVTAGFLTALPVAAQTVPSGYLTDQRGGVVKDPYNLCWRTGYWTPALAILECDPDLVPRPASKPVAAPAPAPTPAPAPAAKPPGPKTLAVESTSLFAFDKAVLTPDAKARIDKEVVGRLGEFSSIQLILVSGFTDRIGSQQYNQKLSERRADAVKAYLVSKGVDGGKIETLGMGKTLQIKSCPDPSPKGEIKTFGQLVECLAPNRRVTVEIKGTGR